MPREGSRTLSDLRSPVLRIACARCGEGINYDREVRRDEKILCEGCASPESRYYRPLTQNELDAANSKAGAETSPQPACEHC